MYGGEWRRVTGLRREEVALLAGISSEYYTRLQRGNATGVSESVIEGIARALQLDEAERIHLRDLLRDAGTSFRATRVAEKRAEGERYEDSGYVLVDELGRALNGRQLREWVYKLVDENGLRRVRSYDARASCFTYLANNGVPDHLLARWAGHTNIKTTKRWYVKPDVEDLHQAADTWGGLASVPAPAPAQNVRCGSVSG